MFVFEKKKNVFYKEPSTKVKLTQNKQTSVIK